MADHIESTKDIVIKMIEVGNIKRPLTKDGYEYPAEDANERYLEEVCKAFKKVYKTIDDSWNGK